MAPSRDSAAGKLDPPRLSRVDPVSRLGARVSPPRRAASASAATARCPCPRPPAPAARGRRGAGQYRRQPPYPESPRTLPEFDRWFATGEACQQYMMRLRWPPTASPGGGPRALRPARRWLQEPCTTRGGAYLSQGDMPRSDIPQRVPGARRARIASIDTAIGAGSGFAGEETGRGRLVRERLREAAWLRACAASLAAAGRALARGASDLRRIE